MAGDTKWCPGFNRDRHEVPVSGFYRNRARDDGLSPRCIECHNADSAQRQRRSRLEAIALLGGRCSSPSCAVPGGMDDPRALQFDHIDGGGNKRQRAGETGHGIVKAILAGSIEFQVLCANCNWIKKHELGEFVGDRDYGRIEPTERVWAPGKGGGRGSSETGRAAIGSGFWDNATPEQVAARNAKVSAGKKGKPNPKVAEARRGTKLVDGHWVRPSG